MTGIIVKAGQVRDISSNEGNLLANFQLRLKQGKLLIGKFLDLSRDDRDFGFVEVIPSSDSWDNAWLSKYIIGTGINLIQVAPELGEQSLKQLANICRDSEAQVLLKLPRANDLPHREKPISWLIKRGLDWLAALVILMLLSPMMMILAVIIAMTSKGSIFFYQWRVGERGRLFQIIKFRTMISDAEQLHHAVMNGQTGLHKCEDDPRITSVGRWMRKYSLDELPQLFNVLRGEMSLVGPRPWALYDALRISGNGKRRLNALPGVTGAWQVSARSTMLDLDDVTLCDLNYLRNWSIWADLKILLMTIPKVLVGFGAH
ncbi:MAG: sugar transferase [Pseudanabaenaceae cyanobacterium bins.39]|nr:sugar transferase [Pseudanabaenaceae cyanobacterium bins.39]